MTKNKSKNRAQSGIPNMKRLQETHLRPTDTWSIKSHMGEYTCFSQENGTMVA